MLAPASCLTLAALRDLPTDLLPPLCQVDAATRGQLLGHLAEVVDGRDPRGLRHRLLPILVLSIFAVMGGATSYAAIAGAAHDITDDLAEAIGIAHPRFGIPDTETIRRALRLLDVGSLEAALRRWATERALEAAAQRAADPANRFGATRALRSVYPMDGKVIRGSALLSDTGTDTATDTGECGEGAVEQVAVFSVLDAASGMVLTQNPIIAGDEVAAAAQAITDLAQVADLGGCLFTADARHTVRATAAQLRGHGAHYLFRVRGNTPTLQAVLKSQPWAQVPGRIARGRGHGRLESRSIKVTALSTAQQEELHAVFPGARQLVKIVRTRRPLTTTKASEPGRGSRARKKITATREVVYYVTSLDYDQADPDLLAGWVVSHWHIENRVHHVRDVTLCEDASRVRLGAGPQVMAAIRNVVISLARLVGAVNVAAITRRWSRRGWEALAVLATA